MKGHMLRTNGSFGEDQLKATRANCKNLIDKTDRFVLITLNQDGTSINGSIPPDGNDIVALLIAFNKFFETVMLRLSKDARRNQTKE